METKNICVLNFRTSYFNKFSEKISKLGLQEGNAVSVGRDSYRHSLSTNISSNDFFDGVEWRGTDKIKPLISFNIDFENTDWYNKSIYKKYYSKYTQNDGEIERVYNFPPNDAVEINNNRECQHNNFKLENSEIEIGKATGLFSLGTINYCPLYQFDDDIRQTRIYLLRKAEENVPLNQLEQSIVDYNNAIEFSKGDYPYEIIYRLPGKKKVSEKVKAKFVYKK